VVTLEALDAVGGHLVFCDPDEFPVPNGSDLESARARLTEIRADRATYEAILAYEGYSDAQEFTPSQQIAISEDYKQMQAIDLHLDGDVYSFSVLVSPSDSDVATMRVSGTVTVHGSVTIDRREVRRRPNCPICLAADVRVATPNGEVPVHNMRAGMQVWTTDSHGRRVAGIVLETGHMEAPFGHEIVRLRMADGRTVMASPGHPTAVGWSPISKLATATTVV
jgi:hypothetical protein